MTPSFCPVKMVPVKALGWVAEGLVFTYFQWSMGENSEVDRVDQHEVIGVPRVLRTPGWPPSQWLPR